jgi:hypothetical protein
MQTIYGMTERIRIISFRKILSKLKIVYSLAICLTILGLTVSLYAPNMSLGAQDLCVDISEAGTFDGAGQAKNMFIIGEPIRVRILAENGCASTFDEVIVTVQFISQSRTTVPNLAAISFNIEPDEGFGAVLSVGRLMEPTGDWTIQINVFDGYVSRGGEPLSEPLSLQLLLESAG